MKSYVSESHIRMVGKGWEVREGLRRLAGADERGDQRLVSILPDLIRCGKPTPPHTQQRTRPQKTSDPHVIPFPSS